MADLILRPARRSPDGFVAQRMLDNAENSDARGPWLLTSLDASQQLNVQVLTDEEVLDWPLLADPSHLIPEAVGQALARLDDLVAEEGTRPDVDALRVVVTDMDRLRVVEQRYDEMAGVVAQAWPGLQALIAVAWPRIAAAFELDADDG